MPGMGLPSAIMSHISAKVAGAGASSCGVDVSFCWLGTFETSSVVAEWVSCVGALFDPKLVRVLTQL